MKKEQQENNKTWNEVVKETVLEALQSHLSLSGIEVTPNPFDEKKRKWQRMTFTKGFSFLVGYDYGKYWMHIEKAPSTFPIQGFLAMEGATGDKVSRHTLEEFKDLFKSLISTDTFLERVKSLLKQYQFKALGGIHKPQKGRKTPLWFSFSSAEGLKITFTVGREGFSMRYEAPTRFPIKRYATTTIDGKPGFTSKSLDEIEEVLDTLAEDFFLWRTGQWRRSFGRVNSIRSILKRRQPLWLIALMTVFFTVTNALGAIAYREENDMLFSLSLAFLTVGVIISMFIWGERQRNAFHNPLVDEKKHILFTPTMIMVIFYADIAWCLFLLGTMLL